ncbi:MAG: hypothetical protein CL910_01470 [Deltaproteobacteria bacterium]|jgi:hypothetical protein|nr:hypothetical protein [Deltaproteobacteria bacterium]
MARENVPLIVTHVIARVLRNGVQTRLGKYRNWPDERLLISDPVALAEERTSKLRRIFDNAGRDAWDGPRLFREAMEKHGGIQLSQEKRLALAQPVTDLMWGELAAWLVSAELAERIDDVDAKLAATAQVFDEARHFYTLRDYLAAMHVPVPKIDPYMGVAVRRLLAARDLVVKLFAMQILAEGAAVAIFRFLIKNEVEPVLCELLPFFERDESRHVGFGVLYLPQVLRELPVRRLKRIRNTTWGIGDLFGATQLRNAQRYQALGCEPRDLIRSADKMLFELGEKIGPIPGTDLRFFNVNPTGDESYEKVLDVIAPAKDQEPSFWARRSKNVIDLGARVL